MTTLEFFRKTFKSERRSFAKVLRALPTHKLDYKPHQRNSSAADIAWFLVLELRNLTTMIETGEMHWKQEPNPRETEPIAAAYDSAADAMEKALDSVDEKKWEQTASMYAGGKLIKSAPLGETVWDFFHDAIHHRGQLTVYIRPMGGTVPSVYGPTADSQ